MIKHNFSIKNIKKQILSINKQIESIFNNLKFFKSNYKKILLDKNNRVFLVSATVLFLLLCYFLMPTLYDKEIIKSQIKNQIQKKYEIKIKFNNEITYGLIPTPHFYSKDLSIMRNEKEIGMAKNFKVLISVLDFFKIDQVSTKNLIFKNTDFNIQKHDYIFFENLLKTEPNENKILIKNSNIFFKDKNDEVLFINKISNSQFYYDSNKLKNIFVSKNKIFNVPFKFKIENDKFNKKVYSRFSSQRIRLDIENEFDYDDNKSGLFDISFINNNTSLTYKINENSINFNSKSSKNKFDGLIEIKPFYLTANFFYDGLSARNLMSDENFLVELIKSEIFKNKNFNSNIKFKIKNITNIAELNNLFLNFNIKEGEIELSNSSLMWKEDLKISLEECFLNYDGNQINLDGKLTLEFIDVENFYRSFQIKKNNRKKIKKIELFFVYDFNQNLMNFSNPRIDDTPNLKIENYFENFNDNNKREFNKVRFKNFVNDFFDIYAG